MGNKQINNFATSANPLRTDNFLIQTAGNVTEKQSPDDFRGSVMGQNTYLIEAESDFPVQDATTITLSSGFYNINALIITGKEIIIPDGTVITLNGSNAFNAGIVYTGTGAMFSGPGDFANLETVEIAISAPLGKVYDFQPGVATGAAITSLGCFYQNIADIGDLVNISIIAVDFAAFGDCGLGLRMSGMDLVSIQSTQFTQWKNQAGSHLTFDGTFGDILINGCSFAPNPNETVFDFKATLNNNTGSITSSPVDLQLGGAVFAAGSKDQKDVKFIFDGCRNIQDSRAFANSIISVPQTVTITATGVPVRVDDANTGGTNIWTRINDERFTLDTTTGEYTYIGEEDVDVTIQVSSSVEKVGGGSDEIGTIVYLNGSPLTESEAVTQNNNPTGIVSLGNRLISNGDVISLYCVNNTGTSNIIFNRNNLIIS